MNIGLYFGTFNPIHAGHLIIANQAINETLLQKIWFIVSPQSPFKINEEMLDEQQRFSLVKASIAGDERFYASDIEFQLSRPSFTINTLLQLSSEHPEHLFSILMGSDSFNGLNQWKSFESIVSKYRIFIYQRPGHEINNPLNSTMRVLNAPLIDISSTMVRDLIANGKSVRYLVPEPARREIEENLYYKK